MNTFTIIGIDPGSTHSGVCVIGPGNQKKPNILSADKVANADLMHMLRAIWVDSSEIAIEGFSCQGRPVGDSSIQTMYLIGRLLQKAEDRGIAITVYKRREYGQWITAGGKLNDATLRAGLESIYGPSAKKTDPLYQLRGTSDKRSAFAVAKYHEFMLSKVPYEIQTA